MYCSNCGAQIPDGSKVCPNCNAELEVSVEARIVNGAEQVINRAENEVRDAFHTISNNMNNGNNGYGNPGNNGYGNPGNNGYGNPGNNAYGFPGNGGYAGNGGNGGFPGNGGFGGNGGYGGRPGLPAGPGGYGPVRVKCDRSLLIYILLSIVTCGLYQLYFIYSLAKDTNTVCEGDGQKTTGLVGFILLTIVTCGIYAWVWYYKLGNRLNMNAGRYGCNFVENGTTVLMWMLFGSLLCGIGPFIALHIIIKNSNLLFGAYNRMQG